MERREKEKIREAVRERYGRIARDGCVSSKTGQKSSCCGPFENAINPSNQSSCCSPTDFSANNISAVIGYSKGDIGSVPEGANMGLAAETRLLSVHLNQEKQLWTWAVAAGWIVSLQLKRWAKPER